MLVLHATIEVDTLYGANHVFPRLIKFLASFMLSLDKCGQHECWTTTSAPDVDNRLSSTALHLCGMMTEHITLDASKKACSVQVGCSGVAPGTNCSVIVGGLQVYGWGNCAC